MSDYKHTYSGASSGYAGAAASASSDARRAYERSRMRKQKHEDAWAEHPVDLNDVCERFVPGEVGECRGVKYIFENGNYAVVADMASGYLRIYAKKLKSYVTLDGSPSRDGDKTHFKILRREEL